MLLIIYRSLVTRLTCFNLLFVAGSLVAPEPPAESLPLERALDTVAGFLLLEIAAFQPLSRSSPASGTKAGLGLRLEECGLSTRELLLDNSTPDPL